MDELKQFLKFAGNAVGLVVATIALVSLLVLGGAWLYGQAKVIVAGFSAEAARIERGE